jgi:potassium efflux system protein
MKKLLRNRLTRFILSFALCNFAILLVNGQDSVLKAAPKKSVTVPNSIKAGRPERPAVGNMARPEHKKIEYFLDTIRRERRKFDSSLFTNISVVSTSDYAEDLGRVYQLLNTVPRTIGSFTKLPEIHTYMDEGDSVLDVLKDRLYQSDRAFNVRNLEMFNTLLDALDKNTGYYSRYLQQYDSALDDVRKEITELQKDTLMLHIFRDTALKNTFQPQLLQLKAKWRQVDSLVTENGKEINTLKSQASAHAITISELLFRVDSELKAVGSAAFGKERRYLLETDTSKANYSSDDLKDSIRSEWQLARVYLTTTANLRNWLLMLGGVFFYWVWWNFKILRRLNKLQVVEPFQFNYINPYPVVGTIIFVLSLAPIFDLHAPSIYIELVQLGLMLLLTIYFWTHLERPLFFGWLTFIFLSLSLLITRVLGVPLNAQRWANFIVESIAIGCGIFFLFYLVKKQGKLITIAIAGYILLNLLAVLCNIFGRVTFSQILGYTAVYSFAQTIGLAIFVRIIQESFLLQIQTSRTKKNYPESFNYKAVSKSISRVAVMFASILWLIDFATNLNLFDAANDLLVNLFTRNRQVGSFSFTIGGIIMFLGIIWLANFLQKYIAYFFGDTGEDSPFDDKGQRSRLMITRLICLIGGFLLAVAASGLPVDRITVILGALGVGVGLGLQNIVSNFVSGIILIFDRPLRIGDTVELGDKRGRVKEIGIRTSTLLTEEGAEVIIPNGDVLSHNIINWTLNKNQVRSALIFTIEKPANPEDVNLDAIREIITKNANVFEQRLPEIGINVINSKTLELKIFFWSKEFNKSSITLAEIKSSIYQFLEQKGLKVLEIAK